MPSLKDIQQEFMALLQENDRHLEKRIIKQGELTNEQRAEIYRTGYRIRLRGVIDSDHEMLSLYLGDDLFDQLVEGYIDNAPSEHPSLRFFAERLPEYLSKTEPFSNHPILAEIAGFERRLLHTFDSADSDTLDQSVLQQIPADAWPTLHFTMHPSIHFYAAYWNSVESWQSLKNETAPPEASHNEQPTIWAIWRGPKKVTEYKSLQGAEWVALQLVMQSKPFSEVCEALQPHLEEEQIAPMLFGYISDWLNNGWITSARG
ncbi:DUF2063 domain-containing protein [Alteromonadaceae bacterium M269]|nr:DUF2063 domain-containing protein [Alteromonadaceae bacterium M269]